MLNKLKNKIFIKPIDEKIGNGLFVSFSELMEQRKFLNYLKKYISPLSKSFQTGDIKSAFKGRGVELEEVRSYNFGDDVRDIDWRVTARRSSPYTKLYVEERDREVYVFLDLSKNMVFGTIDELKSVAAAKIASLLGWLSIENNDRFGMVIFDGKESFVFKPQSNAKNLILGLKKISNLSKNILNDPVYDNDAFLKALYLLKKNAKSQAIVFFISDFEHLEEGSKKPIAALAKSSKLYFMNVVDKLEEKTPLAGEYLAQNDDENLVFDSNSELFCSEYEKYFADKRQKCKDFCNKFKIKYMEIKTYMEIYRQIKF